MNKLRSVPDVALTELALLDQEALITECYAQESEYFPKTLLSSWDRSPKSGGRYFMNADRYFHYAPSHHIAHNLVTGKMIGQWQQDPTAKIISIGAGPAYLEMMLLDRMGLRPEQLTIADIRQYETWEKPPLADIHKKLFNMNCPIWPTEDIGTGYQWVLMPESVVGVIDGHDFQEAPSTEHESWLACIERCMSLLRDGGEFRALTTGRKMDARSIKSMRKKYAGNIASQIDSSFFIIRKEQLPDVQDGQATVRKNLTSRLRGRQSRDE